MDWKQELLKRLDALSDKLGTTGAHLWAVLVRQASLEGGMNIGDAVILVVLAVVGYHFAKHCYRKYVEANKNNNGYSSKGDGWCFGYIALGIVSGALVIIATCIAHQGLLSLLNPEYFALSRIIETFGK